jgi:hypothetical protein
MGVFDLHANHTLPNYPDIEVVALLIDLNFIILSVQPVPVTKTACAETAKCKS